MKAEIHPAANIVNVKCTGCNNTFTIRSTYKNSNLNIEFCNKCHPAYTGKRKIAQKGAIEKFKNRYGDDNPFAHTGS